MRKDVEDMEETVEEFENSVDENLVNFAQKVRDKAFKYPSKRNYSLGPVSERGSSDIHNLTGVDVSGYEHILKGSTVEHIENRHGENGTADRSMADVNDIGRMKYVIDKYDNIELLRGDDGELVLSSEFRDSKNKQAPTVRYQKRVNGTYYVIEAVPDSKAMKLQIVSAYMSSAKRQGRASAALVRGEPRSLQVQLPHAATPTDNVINSQEKVNTQDGNLPQQPESEAL